MNALIHADYRGERGIVVTRNASRFEFRNPGLLLVPEAQARSGGDSQYRNPALQNAFTLVGLAEKAGSGVPRIIQAWNEQQWRPPSIGQDIEAGRTTLTLTRLSLFPPDVLNRLQARFSDMASWTHEERLALATAATEGRVTNVRLQELCDVHSRELTTALGRLVERGALDRHGVNRGTWYTFPADEKSREQVSSRAELIEAVARASRAPRAQMERAVERLCDDRFVDALTIVATLRRSSTRIVEGYLTPMVAAGRLELEFPDSPRHPNQRYRTASQSGAQDSDE